VPLFQRAFRIPFCIGNSFWYRWLTGSQPIAFIPVIKKCWQAMGVLPQCIGENPQVIRDGYHNPNNQSVVNCDVTLFISKTRAKWCD
jgi:hypothetical protein